MFREPWTLVARMNKRLNHLIEQRNKTDFENDGTLSHEKRTKRLNR